MASEAPKQPEKGGGLSTRGAVIAGGAAAGLVLLAVLTALCWPEIQLHYYQNRFSHGSEEEKAHALRWMLQHRLSASMSRDEIEHVLGMPPLTHDEFLGVLRDGMTLAEVKEHSVGIPYRRYYERGAGAMVKWVQFTYYFSDDEKIKTAIVRMFPAKKREATPRGDVWYFSSSENPKLEDYFGDGSNLAEVHPLYFMIDKEPTNIGGSEEFFDAAE